jgi:hypothetical protein
MRCIASDTLTARGAAAIRPDATETIHSDGKLKSFGLRVLPSGARFWNSLYRVPTRRTTRHYDRSTRETATRAALDRWAQRLTQIVTKTPATVAPIRARA